MPKCWHFRSKEESAVPNHATPRKAITIHSEGTLLLASFFVKTFSAIALANLILIGPDKLAAQTGVPDIPVANPARPTVSTPAMLTPVGYLQLENGGLYAEHSTEFSKRLGTNQVTKLGVASRAQLLVLSEPFTHSTGAEVSGNRPGEVFAGRQVILVPGFHCDMNGLLLSSRMTRQRGDVCSSRKHSPSLIRWANLLCPVRFGTLPSH
jgi:hypothetical protein